LFREGNKGKKVIKGWKKGVRDEDMKEIILQ
jgi:hypothetical protein